MAKGSRGAECARRLGVTLAMLYCAIWAQPGAAQTKLWRAFIQSELGMGCGRPFEVNELVATAERAAELVCEKVSCGPPEVISFNYYDDKTVAAFTCMVQPGGGARPWPFGSIPTFLVNSNNPKNAGGCGGSSPDARPCQQYGGTNPINVATGSKVHVDTDYAGSGAYPLRFVHHYNSAPSQVPVLAGQSFGRHRHHNYERSVILLDSAQPTATVYRGDGRAYSFRLSGGMWTPDPDVTERLVRLTDGAGNAAGWQYFNVDDETETYDAAGRLVSIANRAGLAHTLKYNAEGLLERVTDPFGGGLSFTYGNGRRITSMTDPNGGTYAYGYDSVGNLTSITYPDGTTRRYVFEVPYKESLLTGIIDENNVRFATYTYDGQGYATSSEHAGGANRVTLQFGANAQVTDASGTTRLYSSDMLNGVLKNTGVSAPCPTCEAASFGYDSRGYRAYKTDFNGNRTNYTHDARGLEIKRMEGLTSTGGHTAATRTISTEWHPHYRLPVRVAEPLRLTTLVYGAPTDANPGNRGSVSSRTVQATSDVDGSLGVSAAVIGLPRTWTYTYNGRGQVLTADGPRTDVNDVTTYTYYANDATCPGASVTGCRGQLATITNAFGHVTRINEYDAHGQATSLTDPNGLVTVLAYDARLRVVSRNVGGEVTTYGYDATGQLTRVTLPDGAFTAYTYDAAHRLTQITDNEGNRVAYTLDAMGNRTREDVLDPLGTLARTRSRVYDGLNRLRQEIGADHQTTTYAYDRNGNVASIDGPLAGPADVTVNLYDALNRLIRVTDPTGGQVRYGYNGRGELVSVIDPRGLATSYAYDGLDNLAQLTSPDTGVSVNTHDAAGNLLTSRDANGRQAKYTYDALNRVTRLDYLDAGGAVAATHIYLYDGGTNQKGRLTGISEPAGATAYTYDPKGRVATEARTVSGVLYTTGYAYDAHGRLSSMIYPGGRRLSYERDALGRIRSITARKGSLTQVVISGVTYEPFSAPRGFTFGNGQSYARGFDRNGRIASYTLPDQTIAIGYDMGSRIAFLADVAKPENSNTYGYDVLDRMTQFVGPNTAQAFAYDETGNRLSRTAGSVTQAYTYSAATNRLLAITGGAARTYSHDPAGSLTSDGTNTFAYDARGRLKRAANAGATAEYTISSLGQRVRKTTAEGDTVYHYDSGGRLIAESTPAGAIQKEYVYLEDIPVAVLQ